MTNISTILKHNVIGKLLNHLVVFFINVCMARLLGAGRSGMYFNELYLLNFIVFICSAGLDYAVIAMISKDKRLLPFLHKQLLKVSAGFVLMLIALCIWPFHLAGIYFEQPVTAIILFSAGNLLLIFYQGLLSANKAFNEQNIVLLVSNLLFLGFLIYLSGQNPDKTIGFLQAGYALLFFIQGIVMCLLSFGPKLQPQVTVSWRALLKRGVFIMISSLVYFAFLRIDNFFVQRYADDITLGNYVQCGRIGQYFLYFSSVISSTLLPFIAAESVGSSYEEWKKIISPYVLLIGAGALLIALFGKTVFPFLFGDDFNTMHTLMLIMLPGYVCLGIVTLMNAIYIGKGNISKILWGDVMALLLVTILDAIFVPQYGAKGAAIISCTAYIGLFLYLLYGFKKQFSLSAKTTPVIQL